MRDHRGCVPLSAWPILDGPMNYAKISKKLMGGGFSFVGIPVPDERSYSVSRVRAVNITIGHAI